MIPPLTGDDKRVLAFYVLLVVVAISGALVIP